MESGLWSQGWKYLLRGMLFCGFFGWLQPLSGQVTRQVIDHVFSRQHWGANVFAGLPFYELPEGETYRPFSLIGKYHIALHPADKRVNFAINFFPNAGIDVQAVSRELNIEFGFHAGFDMNLLISPEHALGLYIGSGPHFVTLQTRRQSSGFLFSDNFILNYKGALFKKGYLHLFAGFRHISNAGLKIPNFGIDNALLGIGYARQFGRL